MGVLQEPEFTTACGRLAVTTSSSANLRSLWTYLEQLLQCLPKAWLRCRADDVRLPCVRGQLAAALQCRAACTQPAQTSLI
jgi:hypothetical protein